MSLGADWSSVERAAAERFHVAYVAGHELRLARIVAWLKHSSYGDPALTELLSMRSFDGLRSLWSWLLKRETLPGYEPLTTRRDAGATDHPTSSWWPTLATHEASLPEGLGAAWIEDWWLSDAALELCSGIAALVAELLIQQHGWQWQLADAGTPSTANHTLLGNGPMTAAVERIIDFGWYWTFEHFDPQRGLDWQTPVWESLRLAVTRDPNDLEQDLPPRPIQAVWDEPLDSPLDFVLEIYLDQLDPAPTADDPIGALAIALEAHEAIGMAYQSDRETIHGTVTPGTTLFTIVKVAEASLT